MISSNTLQRLALFIAVVNSHDDTEIGNKIEQERLKKLSNKYIINKKIEQQVPKKPVAFENEILNKWQATETIVPLTTSMSDILKEWLITEAKIEVNEDKIENATLVFEQVTFTVNDVFATTHEITQMSAKTMSRNSRRPYQRN